MQKRKVCPTCLQENDASAHECANCAMPFQVDQRTPAVSLELRSDPALRDMGKQLKPPPRNFLALHIVGESEPVLIPYQEQRLLLGRNISEENFSALDLADYHAQVLGMSRMHAAIHITAEACFVEDLNSTNGTWLNESRLAPGQPHILETGDMLRLGHLMLFVSFRA